MVSNDVLVGKSWVEDEVMVNDAFNDGLMMVMLFDELRMGVKFCGMFANVVLVHYLENQDYHLSCAGWSLEQIHCDAPAKNIIYDSP